MYGIPSVFWELTYEGREYFEKVLEGRKRWRDDANNSPTQKGGLGSDPLGSNLGGGAVAGSGGGTGNSDGSGSGAGSMPRQVNSEFFKSVPF